jgi:hypothetical protein
MHLQLRPNFKFRACSWGPVQGWVVNDLFQHPGQVLRYFRGRSSPLWKQAQQPSLNGHLFQDRRQQLRDPALMDLDQQIHDLTGQRAIEDHTVCTNQTKFQNHEYNHRYRDHYWYPHLDQGWTAIVYFDRDSTNIYQPADHMDPLLTQGLPEHADPWRPQRYWHKVAEIGGDVNQLVLFNAGQWYHGMNITDTKYFTAYRFNLCLFYA